ncbi:MAG: MFS transporter [Bacillota bacterium]|nr:hypothetical protein [Bacillota bacterium]
MQQASTRVAGRRAGVRPLDFIALTLVAVNVQAGMVATGPVAPLIRSDLSLSNSTLGLITAIPPVAMGAAAVPGALLARRLEPSRAWTWSMALLAAGGLLRALAPGAGSLALATIVMCLGAGLVTAAFPSLAATRFAADPGLATGFYTGGTAGGALLASGLTATVLLPLAGGSWRGAFASWGLLAAAAWLVWWAVDRAADPTALSRWDGNSAAQAGGGDSLARTWGGVLRQGRAWLLALLFASQSATFFTAAAWIPPLYSELGLSEAAASVPLLVLSVVQIPAAFLFPLAAGRTGRYRPLLLASAAINAVGVAGLALAPGAAPWLWGAAVGIGLGGLFSICMMLPVALFPTHQVGAATGVMLTVGYLLASLGPLTMGALRDASGSYTAGMLALAALAVPMMLIILALGRSPGRA